jgi:negative regulator of flagellin synthesis FlgM
MRIDNFNSSPNELSSQLSSQPVSKQTGAQATPADTEDRATLTSDSTSLNSLLSTAMSTPEVRQGTVDSLREAVNSGTYELDPNKIAASMVNEFA